MPEENKGAGGENQTQVTPEVVAKLQEQVENLNKGISSYRDEIKLYKENYEKLQDDFEEFKSSVEVEDESDDKKVQINPDDEKKLEAWAKQKGFVSQTEMQIEKQKLHQESIKSAENQAISEFLQKHPEYDSDENWQKVLAEFQSGLYRQPTTLSSYQKLLDRIHKDLTGDPNRAREEGKVQAKLENQIKGRLSLGGGSQGSGQPNDKDIEELQKRYPKLSRGQIEERLSEIRSLYSNK